MSLTVKIGKLGTRDLITLAGSINEAAGPLLTELHLLRNPSCVIDFGGVTHINSSGVRAWITFMRRFAPGRDLSFERCTPPIVSQIVMIETFRSGARIASLSAVVRCSECDLETARLYSPADAAALRRGDSAARPDPMLCRRCGRPMELKDAEEVQDVLSLMCA